MLNSIYVYILGSILFCFGLSLGADFVFDDSKAIVTNVDVLRADISLDLWHHDFWGGEMTSTTSHKSYRPLTVLTFCIIRRLTGTLSPFYFHLTNLVFYYLLCCLLYRTLLSFLSDPIVSFPKNVGRRVSTLVTILFTVHPVHSEAICSCVGLADIMSALFSVVAFSNHLASNRQLYSDVKKKIEWFQHSSRSMLTIILVAISFLFKEQGITLLGILIILDLCQWRQLHHRKPNDSQRLLIAQVLLYLTMLALLIRLRIDLMAGHLPKFSAMDNPAWHVENRWYRIVNFNYIYLWNAVIILCPAWLCFDWSMGCIPVIQSLDDYRILFVFLFVLCMLIFFATTLLVSKLRLLSLFSIFFLLPFVPSSNLFFQVGFVVAERNLFMPIVGYLLIFCYCLVLSSQQSFLPKKMLHYGAAFMLVVFALRSFERTQTWHDEKTLFGKDLSICRNNAKIWYNLAKKLSEEGDVDKAIHFYNTSIELYGNYTSALNNLANIYIDRGDKAKAKELLTKTITIDPTFSIAWMNLATIEKAAGNFNQSEKYFLNSIRLSPKHANSHYNLGNLYLDTKELDKAEHHFHQAIQFEPEHVDSWKNLILVVQNNNQQYDRAIDIAHRAIEAHPSEPEFRFLLATIYGLKGEFEPAEEHFRAAIARQRPPGKPIYHYNLAVLYHQHGQHRLAIEQYEATLKLNPAYKQAQRYLTKLRARVGSQ